MTNDVAGPRRGRPGHDQDAVLRVAIDLFNRQGYDGTSMSDLAHELGLTKAAIYHHVPSKEHLLSAALNEALDGLESAIAAAAKAPGSAHDRLRAVVRESALILIHHLPAVTLLLRVRGNSPVERTALDRRRLIDERLAEIVAGAVAEGSIRADIEPALTSRLLFGMVNSLVEWFRLDGPVDAETVATAIADIAFDGLTTHRD